MKYSKEEVLDYVREEDVKFIRLAFCDVYGKQKNISIMPGELPRAFGYGIAVDASAIVGFGDEAHSDLLLHPHPETLTVLPWRPEQGRVVRMFADVSYPDGQPFPCDSRYILRQAVAEAERKGYHFSFGSELEFYLFRLDDAGAPTRTPYDQAGYMDIAPEDRGENVRREICLNLEQMGICPESSHHEAGPGQNEIDFRYADAMTAADDAMTFETVVKTMAWRNGVWADFSPKPMEDCPGNGFHINLLVHSEGGADCTEAAVAGILSRIRDMTVFLNPVEASYRRLGSHKAPVYISWSKENRSQLIRIPAAEGEYRRAELRSPDPMANPYLAFALLIYAGLEGVEKKLILPPSQNVNLYRAEDSVLSRLEKLPGSLAEARFAAADSDFIGRHLPQSMIKVYCGDETDGG